MEHDAGRAVIFIDFFGLVLGVAAKLFTELSAIMKRKARLDESYTSASRKTPMKFLEGKISE